MAPEAPADPQEIVQPPMSPEQMVVKAVQYLGEIAEHTRVIRDLLDGTEEDIGMSEHLSTVGEILDASDDALRGLIDKNTRFTAAAFIRGYVQRRDLQESEDSGDPEGPEILAPPQGI